MFGDSRCAGNSKLFFSIDDKISKNYPTLFETDVEETGGEQGNKKEYGTNNGTNNIVYGLMLYVLTFVRLSRLNILEALEQPITLVFSVLAVEIERNRREQETLKKTMAKAGK